MDLTTIIVAIIGSGLLNTLLGYLVSARQKKQEENSDVNKALRLIMKDRLRFLCRLYINQGWIYEDELDDLIAMHNCYHNDLKGNGFLDSQMQRVKNLEVRGMGVR